MNVRRFSTVNLGDNTMPTFQIRTENEDQIVKRYLDDLWMVKFHCHYHCGYSPLDHSCSHKSNDAGKGWCQEDKCPLALLPSFSMWKLKNKSLIESIGE